MIGGFGHGGAVRALQEETAALRAQLAALEAHIATLLAQLTNQVARSVADAAGIVAIEQRVGGCEAGMAAQAGLMETQTETLRAHAATIAGLEEATADQDERIGRNGGGILRLEMQAAIDLAEMRRSHVGMTEAFLRQHPPALRDGLNA